MTTNQWNDGWPDWRGGGRRVQFQMADGTQHEGDLEADDVGFDGEDEYPIWVVRNPSGEKLDFVGAERWRFA